MFLAGHWRSGGLLHCLRRESRESAERNALNRQHPILSLTPVPRRVVSFPCMFYLRHPNINTVSSLPLWFSLVPVCCQIIHSTYHLVIL
ncbi:hypothetical protein PAXRUDRAFT_571666 [Paxillus rubicundulus Ve08.2h10]|uniref:Uncharacterized protein n=1 Tax=Paxillus rubicundulus Ve08.2h10 TaxID=930991 RepID=A0A0D0BQQ1_9AGAM|nr:hypothetical protein PAXRUDRAFT_571666 [Paxillus rubicundulus Ve08.2h10]